jgi:Kef-type K+ transport system membrane component KefB
MGLASAAANTLPTHGIATKFAGILPLTRIFAFEPREGMYTTLLMSTGLTFGSISALFGLTNHIIDQRQYTILVMAVIGSAVVPTLIAQRWFMPTYRPLEGVEAEPGTDVSTRPIPAPIGER